MPAPTGSVYHQGFLAGELKQEPGGRCVFTYDNAYLEAYRPDIAFTLPRSGDPYVSEAGLHPFFDNLVAEGRLRDAQARALGAAPEDRFALLMAFGHDCAGAVSVRAPTQQGHRTQTWRSCGHRRSDEPGVPVGRPAQDPRRPRGQDLRPARRDETSRFIAKLPSGSLRDIVENEFITTEVTRALLPDDRIVRLEISSVDGVEGRALLVERFDRLRQRRKDSLRGVQPAPWSALGDDKYDARYDDMAAFILGTPDCTPVDAWRLYRRELVCFLTGNTDAHLKNFAMFHASEGLRLTPAYDLVATRSIPIFGRRAGARRNPRPPD